MSDHRIVQSAYSYLLNLKAAEAAGGPALPVDPALEDAPAPKAKPMKKGKRSAASKAQSNGKFVKTDNKPEEEHVPQGELESGTGTQGEPMYLREIESFVSEASHGFYALDNVTDFGPASVPFVPPTTLSGPSNAMYESIFVRILADALRKHTHPTTPDNIGVCELVDQTISLETEFKDFSPPPHIKAQLHAIKGMALYSMDRRIMAMQEIHTAMEIIATHGDADLDKKFLPFMYAFFMALRGDFT